MIHISVEAVNLRSPYKVKQEDENIFSFRTKHGIVYNVGFVPDTSFMKEGSYQFFINNLSGRTSRIDNAILETVRVIIEKFFAQKEAVMLYICDTTDKRQASRERLFRIWFHTYEQSDSYSLYGEWMIIDNIHYFSSVLLRKDHPLHNQVLNTFHNFIVAHNEG